MKLIIPYREVRNVTPAYIKAVGDAWNEFFDALCDMQTTLVWACSRDPRMQLYVKPENLGDGVLN